MKGFSLSETTYQNDRGGYGRTRVPYTHHAGGLYPHCVRLLHQELLNCHWPLRGNTGLSHTLEYHDIYS